MGKQRINTDNLQKITNGEYTYKQLCDYGIFIDGAKTGNTKIAQISDLKQYFEIDSKSKRGKIIIQSKKKEMEVKKFTRVRTGKYSESIQELLLKELYKTQDNRVSWSLNTILEKVSMINPDYISYRGNMEELAKEIKIDEIYIRDFYSYYHKNLRIKVETTLNNLNKKNLITWSKVMIINLWEKENIYKKDGEPLLDNHGNNVYRQKEVFRRAREDESKIIEESEKIALAQLKCKNKGQIIRDGLWKEYDELVYNELKKVGIRFYYNAYEIEFSRSQLEDEVLISDFRETSVRVNLNEDICNSIINCSNTRHKNALDKRDIVLCLSLSGKKKDIQRLEKNDMLCNNEYLHISKKIVKSIIAIK